MAELQLLTLEIREFRFFEPFHLTLPSSLPPSPAYCSCTLHHYYFCTLSFFPFLFWSLSCVKLFVPRPPKFYFGFSQAFYNFPSFLEWSFEAISFGHCNYTIPLKKLQLVLFSLPHASSISVVSSSLPLVKSKDVLCTHHTVFYHTILSMHLLSLLYMLSIKKLFSFVTDIVYSDDKRSSEICYTSF